MRLSELSTVALAEALQAGAVALWPMGATEAHGPHLPLGTDVIIAETTALAAAARIAAELDRPALVLPPLAFSVTEFAENFKGSITIPKAVVAAYVEAVLRSTRAQGFAALCLVNAHLEPAHRFMLRDAVAAVNQSAGAPVGIADPADRRFASRLTAEFKSASCHAGQYESSLILAARPELVDEAVRSGLPERTVNLLAAGAAPRLEGIGAPEAYCGHPAGASAAEGRSSFDQLAAIVVEVVRELLTGPSHEC